MRATPTPITPQEFASSGSKIEPGAPLYASGYIPEQILPAEIFNWLMNLLTKNNITLNPIIDSLNKELLSVLTLAGASPDNSFVQVRDAMESLYMKASRIPATYNMNSIVSPGDYSWTNAGTTNFPSSCSAGDVYVLGVLGKSANVVQILYDLTLGVTSPHYAWIRQSSDAGTSWTSWTRQSSLPLPGFSIDTSGNVTCLSLNATSRMSEKKDIVDFTDSGIDIVESTAIKKFKYINDSEEEQHAGFLADFTDSLLSGKNKDHMDMGNCIAVLFKAVQELIQQNRELKAILEERV